VRLSAGCPARIKFELLVHENETNKLSNTFFVVVVKETILFAWQDASEPLEVSAI
jgi:DTW domain-containing protein YfiP